MLSDRLQSSESQQSLGEHKKVNAVKGKGWVGIRAVLSKDHASFLRVPLVADEELESLDPL